jgi:hypothetical protein
VRCDGDGYDALFDPDAAAANMSPAVYSHDQMAARVLVVALAFIVGMIAGVSFSGLLGRWAALPPECNGVVLRGVR